MRYYHNYFKLFQRDSAVKCSYNLKYIQRVNYKGFSLDHVNGSRQFIYFLQETVFLLLPLK